MSIVPVQERSGMSIETTYTSARENLAALCDEVSHNREIVIITRRGSADVALVAADELASLLETAHLLRSPRNAQRLLTALKRAKAGTLKPKSVASLRQEMGLGKGE
jgi:antitoxin YefM